MKKDPLGSPNKEEKKEYICELNSSTGKTWRLRRGRPKENEA